MEEAEAKAAAAIQCQIEMKKAMEVDFWAQIPYISSFCFFDDLSGSSCGDNAEVFLTKISGTLN